MSCDVLELGPACPGGVELVVPSDEVGVLALPLTRGASDWDPSLLFDNFALACVAASVRAGAIVAMHHSLKGSGLNI